MQVDLAQIDFTSIPGSAFDIVIEVRNTSTVIDGARATVLGLDPAWVTGEPGYVALFPDASDQLRMRVRLPETFPAGDHTLQVSVASDVDPSRSRTLTAALHVVELSEPDIAVKPQTVTTRHDAHYDISCTNHGNAPTTLELVAFDVEHELELRLQPSVVELAPGTTTNVVLDAFRRRRPFGGVTTYPITVRATSPSHQIETRATYIQRPVVSPGLLTAGILAAIVLLWALAFLGGIDRLLGGDDDVAKAAPVSFYEPAATGADVDGIAQGSSGADAASKGIDITAVGGDTSGVVVGPDGDGVPGLTVTAVRRTKDGINVDASSAATDDDGAYTVGPLVPGRYVLRVEGPGYDPVYAPGVELAATATPVEISTGNTAPAPRLTIRGEDGSISGVVVTGPGPIGGVPVVIRSVLGGVEQPVDLAQVVTAEDGSFVFPGLATPMTYEVTVAPASSTYAPAKTRVPLRGGENLAVNTVVAAAAGGSVSGLVTNADGTPLGGVEVVASSGGTTFSTSTPTVGAVGAYSLPDIETPATYLLSFSLDGLGQETVVVDLGPGEDRTLDIVIRGGTVTVTGSVSGRAGPGAAPVRLDGAQVRVQADSVDITTTTNTNGDFLVPGIQPGARIAVTVSADGFVGTTRTTVAQTGADGLDLVIDRALRTVVARATRSGSGLSNAEVVLTDGVTPRTIQSASTPAGTLRFTDIAFGSYSLRITAPDGASTTRLFSIDENTPATLDLGDIDVPAAAP